MIEDIQAISRLGKMIKERDNIEGFGIGVATVTSLSPLILKTTDKIFISKEYNNMAMTETFNNKLANITINDKVLVMPISSGDIWYIIDKVVM